MVLWISTIAPFTNNFDVFGDLGIWNQNQNDDIEWTQLSVIQVLFNWSNHDVSGMDMWSWMFSKYIIVAV